MTLLVRQHNFPALPAMESSSEQAPSLSPRGGWRQAGSARAAMPSLTSPTPIGGNRSIGQRRTLPTAPRSAEIPQATAMPLPRRVPQRYHRTVPAVLAGPAGGRKLTPVRSRDGKIAGDAIGGPAFCAWPPKGDPSRPMRSACATPMAKALRPIRRGAKCTTVRRNAAWCGESSGWGPLRKGV